MEILTKLIRLCERIRLVYGMDYSVSHCIFCYQLVPLHISSISLMVHNITSSNSPISLLHTGTFHAVSYYCISFSHCISRHQILRLVFCLPKLFTQCHIIASIFLIVFYIIKFSDCFVAYRNLSQSVVLLLACLLA